MTGAKAVVVLLALVVAGCAGPGGADDLPVEAAEVFEPLDIQVRELLVTGFQETEWAFEVGPGATGRIDFRLEGIGVLATQDLCFRYEVAQVTEGAMRHEASERCTTDNVVGGSVQAGDDVLYSSPALPGTYWFFFAADEALAEFVVDVRVDYG